MFASVNQDQPWNGTKLNPLLMFLVNHYKAWHNFTIISCEMHFFLFWLFEQFGCIVALPKFMLQLTTLSYF